MRISNQLNAQTTHDQAEPEFGHRGNDIYSCMDSKFSLNQSYPPCSHMHTKKNDICLEENTSKITFPLHFSCLKANFHASPCRASCVAPSVHVQTINAARTCKWRCCIRYAALIWRPAAIAMISTNRDVLPPYYKRSLLVLSEIKYFKI